VKFDLGFLHPLLGPAKELGQHMKEGIEAAFNVANAKGGCTAASFGWSRLTTAGRAGCSCTSHGQFYHRRFSSNLSRCEYGPSSKSCDALGWCRGSLSSTRSNPSYSWPQSKDATTRRARLARTPLSGIFRSVDELKAPNLGCFQPVHGSKADDTSRCIIFALGNQQRRLRIKGSAMWAEEGATF